jgi:phosphoribosylaminoimidazolecarboxamide formyltransferase/IMP cyclohydrolase
MKKIKRALISVSDKKNLNEIVNYLQKNNIEIISTGGTYKKIKEFTDNVIEISEYTGFPEIMNGRVKTLNPLIHGGILADRNKETHHQDLKDNNISLIDLVIVNLYPFEETVSRETTYQNAIENIDVGGPTMIRAAAKNHHDVLVITDPNDYQVLIDKLEKNNNHTDLEFRKIMARKAFSKTAKYDKVINEWFEKEQGVTKNNFSLKASLKQKLRYGENPHQEASLYSLENGGICNAKQIQGKELSFNNIVDTDSAFNLVSEYEEVAVAIIKHANPCGVATGKSSLESFKKAFNCDPISSFGGVVALNSVLNKETALEIKKVFFEVVIAKEVTEEAKEILAVKKNMRILIIDQKNRSNNLQLKSVSGGILTQSYDNKMISIDDFNFVTKRKPTENEMQDLLFATKANKHVRSNAILYAKNQTSIAIGAGQMSRVDSVRMANIKLNDFISKNLDFSKEELVMASDAFFPFADGVELAAQADITAIIQPGGSIRDQEVIEMADKYNVAMVFTGVRFFKH